MKKKSVWLGIGLALMVPAFVFASNLTVPNTFWGYRSSWRR